MSDEQRQRAHLLHDFERSPLAAANFAVLKGMRPPVLEATLSLARAEREERRQSLRKADKPA